MKKILLIVPYNKYTIGLCSLNIYKMLVKRSDIILKCVIIHKFKDGYKEFDNCDFCIDGANKGIKNLFSFIKELKWLRKIKKDFKPNISISTLFCCSNISVLTGGNDLKIGIFHSPHTQEKVNGKLKYCIRLLTYRILYPKLDRLYCVSEGVRQSIVSTFKNIDPNKVEVVYNIHDKENILKKSQEKLSTDEDKIFENPVILYCGRLDKNKAPERLLKAFIASDKIPENTNLVYIGEDVDNLKSLLKNISEKTYKKNRVYILGRKDNPYKYMIRASVFVSCSYSEGLPGVIIESLILGTPVVTTNSSIGVWEILKCNNAYDQKLKSCYFAKKGIITSNLFAYDKSELAYETDIKNLTKAIELIFDNKYRKAPFEFEKNILADNLSEKYIE